MSALESLREFVNGLELFDTHEHLVPESDWIALPEGQADFSYFFSHYASVDLVSAGMPPKDLEQVRSDSVPVGEKWRLFEPWWERARNTTYCRCIARAIRELYGLPELSRDTVQELSYRMQERQKPGWYRRVLKEKARIYRSVLNLELRTDVDRDLFAPVISFDYYTLARPDDLAEVQKDSGFEINSVSALTGALTAAFEKRIREQICGVKVWLAYYRTLAFEDPPRAKAEEALEKLLRAGKERLPRSETKPLEDFMFHQVIQRAVEHHLPVQIHTGMQEGNGNYLSWSMPTLLTPILMKYPEARFDLFHAAYPYSYELGVLAKMFPSVHPDMCWTHIITPQGARRILSEWLEMVPASKIFAFGGDYVFVEGVYAHSLLARENVAQVLAQKVDEGYFTHKEAERIASRILLENGKEFFSL